MTSTTDLHEVVGRDAELLRVERFLERVDAGPGALVLEGEPGIGKTELWRAATARAQARGLHVLDARPSQAEDGLAFAALGDLLAGARDEIAALPVPQRRPLAVALLLGARVHEEGQLVDPAHLGFEGFLRLMPSTAD
jgi:MoxR-like ATPase